MLKILKSSILLSAVTVACTSVDRHDRSHSMAASGEKAPAKIISRQAVVAYHPLASQIGLEVLQKGGNAFDAFVAATAVEYVLGEGVTSLGGPLGAILYDAKTATSDYLDAGFNTPLDPKQKWDPQNPQPGSAALVPGAVAGLEAISKKYGKLSLAEALAPAIRLAEVGFVLNKTYADLLHSDYGLKLRANSYAFHTYFKNGELLNEGDILKLPKVAQFLRQVAKFGSVYVYKGKWAKECLKIVNSSGGHLRSRDFSTYKVKWLAPWHVQYHDEDIFSARTVGGLNTVLSLKILEKADLAKYGKHFSSSAEALELLTRIQDEVAALPELRDHSRLEDPEFEKQILSATFIDPIWNRIDTKMKAKPTAGASSHSYHIVVVDENGNAISGTNTIESFPWGKGLFVEGIPLTDSGILPFNTKAGERRSSPLTMQIGLKNKKLHFASGAFSASMTPAAFEFIVNILDYHLSANEVVSLPRFGDWVWDMQTMKLTGGRWLDPRVDAHIVATLASRDINFVNQGYIDTGLGSVAIVNDEKGVEGSFVPLSSNHRTGNKFAGIGATLESAANGDIFIREILADSPALKAHLEKGDIIISVQSSDSAQEIFVKGKQIQEVIRLIRGPVGTAVLLKISKPAGQSEVKIIRALIQAK